MQGAGGGCGDQAGRHLGAPEALLKQPVALLQHQRALAEQLPHAHPHHLGCERDHRGCDPQLQGRRWSQAVWRGEPFGCWGCSEMEQTCLEEFPDT